jgi:hypothetical protein
VIDADAQRIRDAFDHDLAGYRAPHDLGERARAGGLWRARRQRMHRTAAAAAAVACAAAVTVAVIAPGIGSASGGGRVSAQPGTRLPVASRELPSAGAVGHAMLTSVDAARDDIGYFKQTDLLNGAETNEIQDWTWPAQPAPGQPVRERQLYAGRLSAADKFMTVVQDEGEAYITQARPNTETSVTVTMVCYRSAAALGGGTGCGYSGGNTPAGTWSQATVRYQPFPNPIGPGAPLNPAVLAQAIALGQQWRVLSRTELNGQQAIELGATASNPVLPKPVLLWIDSRSYLPLRMTTGGGIVDDFGYLPPASPNLKLLQVPIPPGYSQSSP